MADGHDGFDKSLEYREGGGGGSFLMGLLTGTVIGAGLGMLFARELAQRRGRVASRGVDHGVGAGLEAGRHASESAGQWAEKGRDVYNKASEAVVKGAQEAQKYVRATARSSGSERS